MLGSGQSIHSGQGIAAAEDSSPGRAPCATGWSRVRQRRTPSRRLEVALPRCGCPTRAGARCPRSGARLEGRYDVELAEAEAVHPPDPGRRTVGDDGVRADDQSGSTGPILHGQGDIGSHVDVAQETDEDALAETVRRSGPGDAAVASHRPGKGMGRGSSFMAARTSRAQPTDSPARNLALWTRLELGSPVDDKWARHETQLDASRHETQRSRGATQRSRHETQRITRRNSTESLGSGVMEWAANLDAAAFGALVAAASGVLVPRIIERVPEPEPEEADRTTGGPGPGRPGQRATGRTSRGLRPGPTGRRRGSRARRSRTRGPRRRTSRSPTGPACSGSACWRPW